MTRRTRHESPRRFDQLADVDWLRREYVENGRTMADIAGEIGCTRHGVAKALKRRGVVARPPGPKSGGDHSDPHARLLLGVAAQLREEGEWVTDVRQLAWRVKAVHEARVRDERFALRSAVFDLIVAACLAAVSLDDSESPSESPICTIRFSIGSAISPGPRNTVEHTDVRHTRTTECFAPHT